MSLALSLRNLRPKSQQDKKDSCTGRLNGCTAVCCCNLLNFINSNLIKHKAPRNLNPKPLNPFDPPNPRLWKQPERVGTQRVLQTYLAQPEALRFLVNSNFASKDISGLRV